MEGDGSGASEMLVRSKHIYIFTVTSGSEWVRTSENESGVSRDLASAYVLCLCTFVVPNLQRDEGKSLGKKGQIGKLRKLTRMNEVDF